MTEDPTYRASCSTGCQARLDGLGPPLQGPGQYQGHFVVGLSGHSRAIKDKLTNEYIAKE
jgi:hypothetical protein